MNACDDITDCANCGWQDDCFYTLKSFTKGYVQVKEGNPNEAKRIISDTNNSKHSNDSKELGIWK